LCLWLEKAVSFFSSDSQKCNLLDDCLSKTYSIIFIASFVPIAD
jgi:hypothetical protein